MKNILWLGVTCVSLGMPLAGGALAQSTNATVITSEKLSFDYKRSIAVFEGNVVVEDPQLKMRADKLNVLFEGTNSVKSVVAVGNVLLWYGDKTASCRHAIYVAKTGEITLRGNAALRREQDSVTGEEIVFYLNEERVECRPGRLVIFPESRGQIGLENLPRRQDGGPRK